MLEQVTVVPASPFQSKNVTKISPPSSDTTPTSVPSKLKANVQIPALKVETVAEPTTALGRVLAKAGKGTNGAKAEASLEAHGGQEVVTEGVAVETTTEAKPTKADSAKLERLNRLAAADRKRDAEMKTLRAEVERLGGSEKELKKLKDLSKNDRITLMEELGLDFQTLAEEAVQKKRYPKPPGERAAPEDPVKKIAAELEALKAKDAEQAQRASFAAELNAFTNAVNGVLARSQDPEEFELILKRANVAPKDPQFGNAATEDAVQLTQAYHAETGEWMHPADVARNLEAYYEREAQAEFDRLSASKKLQKRFGLTKKEADEAIAEVRGEDVASTKPVIPSLGSKSMSQKNAAPPAKNSKKVKPAGMSELAWIKAMKGMK